MTSGEFTKAAKAIFRNAVRRIDDLIRSQNADVYRSEYGMRRKYKHNDDSDRITNGHDVIYDIMAGKRDNFAVATPAAVERLKRKIAEDEVDICSRRIESCCREIVESESSIRRAVASGAVSKKKAEKIIAKNRKKQ